MKWTLLALAIITSAASAEATTPAATQVGDAIRPAAEAYGKTVGRLVNEFFAGSPGPMGAAARASLKAHATQDREANRGTRRNMKDCIKPGNVIDDDVKECIEGLRVKDW